MLIENLESRTYFAAFTCTLKNGVITFTGTKKDDVISVNNVDANTVNVSGASVSGEKFTKNFKTSAIKQVKVIAGGGNDYVTCFSLSNKIKLTIDGGAGDDILQGSVSGKNLIIGGAGKDIMSAGNGGATFEAKGDKAVDSITAWKKDIIHADKNDSITKV